MKFVIMTLSALSLMTMSGLYLKECIETPLGISCRIKTGLAMIMYATLALIMIWGMWAYPI